MQITSGKIPGAIKVVVYGPEGIGKTTFASRFPEPLFIDTENSTAHMDVRRLPRPDAWSELLGEVNYIHLNTQLCRTLVIDTLDWAERLCSEHVCARDQKTGIEDYGYGKGYKYVSEEFSRLLDNLELVRAKGVNIVLCCHAAITKFEQPDELGAYDRWGLKLINSPKASIAGMVKEWADMVLFANYKTIVVNTDGKGAAKGRNKAQGGRRVMYTTHHPCWDAKNRFGLPEEADFSYEVIRPIIESSVQAPAEKPMPATEKKSRPEPPRETPPAPPAGLAEGPLPPEDMDIYAGLPPTLIRMMQEAEVTPDEVKGVIAQKGIYPLDTPWPTICANDNFMKGWLLHPQVWPQVVSTARMNREDDPF